MVSLSENDVWEGDEIRKGSVIVSSTCVGRGRTMLPLRLRVLGGDGGSSPDAMEENHRGLSLIWETNNFRAEIPTPPRWVCDTARVFRETDAVALDDEKARWGVCGEDTRCWTPP